MYCTIDGGGRPSGNIYWADNGNPARDEPSLPLKDTVPTTKVALANEKSRTVVAGDSGLVWKDPVPTFPPMNVNIWAGGHEGAREAPPPPPHADSINSVSIDVKINDDRLNIRNPRSVLLNGSLSMQAYVSRWTSDVERCPTNGPSSRLRPRRQDAAAD